MQLPNYVNTTLEALKHDHYEAYLVGGCVRDLLLKKMPNDYDITTNALPDEIKQVFSAYKTIDIGIEHGTIDVVVDGKNVEVTTYRIDGEYKDNRHPESVTFTANLVDDLSRRDFTINAIAFDNDFIDPFNGKDDLENHLIRAVGDPYKRFKEDALRIMRAIRFAAVLNFEIETETERAMFELKENLNNISVERIRVELDKMLFGVNVYSVLMKYHEILSVFIPEIIPCIGFDQMNPWHIYNVWEHIAVAVINAPLNHIVRLSLLMHDIAKPLICTNDKNGQRHFYGHAEMSAEIARKILKRLKYDNKTIDTVYTLIKHHDDNNQNIDNIKVVKSLMSIMGEETFELLLDVKFGDNAAKSELSAASITRGENARKIVASIIEQHLPYRISDLDIRGNELEDIGFSGENIGKMLKNLLNMVIGERIENKNEKLLDFSKKMLDNGFVL